MRAQPALGPPAPAGVPPAPPSATCPGRDGKPSLGPGEGPLGRMWTELLLAMAPTPSTHTPTGGLASTRAPTHVLGSIVAGLLGGQLSDQQGLQELAHEIEVLVEGAEGILGRADSQEDRQMADGDKARGPLMEGRGTDGWRISWLFSSHINRAKQVRPAHWPGPVPPRPWEPCWKRSTCWAPAACPSAGGPSPRIRQWPRRLSS